MPIIVKGITLKFVKSIAVEFCPWQSNVQSVRQLQSRLANSKVRETNTKCSLKMTIKHDGSPPMATIVYNNGKQLIFKTGNLTSAEMLQRFGALNLQMEKALE